MSLDNLVDAFPMISELTSAVPRPLEAWQLERAAEAWDLGIVFVMHHWGLAVAGCVGMLLILYGIRLTRASTSQDVSTGMLNVLGMKFTWRGPAGVGCMLGGTAVLLLALWKNQLFQ